MYAGGATITRVLDAIRLADLTTYACTSCSCSCFETTSIKNEQTCKPLPTRSITFDFAAIKQSGAHMHRQTHSETIVLTTLSYSVLTTLSYSGSWLSESTSM